MQITMITKNTFVEFTSAEAPLKRSMSFPLIDLPMMPLVVEPVKPISFGSSISNCSTAASECDAEVSPAQKAAPWRTLDVFADKNARDESEYTTVMIRKIPNRYTQDMLLEEIQTTGYDLNFLHLPLVAKSNANVGYAFANFSSPEEAVAFMKDFEGHELAQQEGNVKFAQVNYARLQGFEENLAFFEGRRIAETDRKPWVKAASRSRAQTM
jgi:hypothetical protein